MALTRRRFIAGMVAVTGSSTFAINPAYSQQSQLIHLIVGNGPGSPPDVRFRELAGLMSKSLGQQIIVINKPGAGGILASREVERAKPDGHTILALSVNHLIKDIREPEGAPFLDRFDLVTSISASPLILFINSNLPIKNFKEFVAYARANPKKLSYGTGGPESVEHVFGKRLFSSLGIELTEVPYPVATRAIVDVLGGNVSCGFGYLVTIGQHIGEGQNKLRTLGVGASQRLDAAPDIPTFAEQGADAPLLNAWQGLAVRKGTPQAFISKLQTSAAGALQDADLRKRWLSEGSILGGEQSDTYSQFVRSQRQILAQIVNKQS